MSILMDSPNKPALVADIVAYDRDDMPIMIAEVKRNISDENKARAQLTHYLEAAGLPVPFGMLADLQTTQFFLWNGVQLSEPIARFATKNLVSLYDAEFSTKTIYEPYLAALLSSWLRDMIFHWKSAEPPEWETLKQLGFAGRLAGGSVFVEVNLR